eukprot:TRINITY_DN191_c0_g1_i3.p1 TRINITY_DN191_c0_g1~~TRINITY_DN191_c0_g1_i3.p1  ORF type:complete len:153 (-),score=11.10 TRINITY_DN191_c0_g1_i3:265-723(-)
MSGELVIYGGAGNANVFKSAIAAEYVGVKVKLTENFTMNVTNKTPEYLEKNPFGLVPLLETPEGPVYESNSIARHVCRLGDKDFYGKTNYEMTQTDQWLDVTRSLEPNIAGWLYPYFGFGAMDENVNKSKETLLNKWLPPVNKHLEKKSMVG